MHAKTPPVLQDPVRNRGTAFTASERSELGLTGRLPAAVTTLEEQAARAYAQLQMQPTDLAKNIFMAGLQDINEVLYFRLLTDHLVELNPIVYDPTVGDAIQRYSHEYRRPRGVYLSIDHQDQVRASFEGLGLGPDDVDLIVVTDAQEILGIGDWGVNGIDICVGKLAIYTGAGGIHPGRVIAVGLDCGTDDEVLLNDLLYLGNRRSPTTGKPYDEFVALYLKTVSELFPNAIQHVKPTILLGTSTDHGAFTRQVIEAMCAGVDKPIVLPISNPTSKTEAMPSDVIPWSKGKALVATGIPLDPVTYNGVDYQIGQANNALLYPGLGLGTIVSRARHVTKNMLVAAADAVAGQVDPTEVGALLVPPVANLRASSAIVAAVVQAAIDDGVATVRPDDIVQAVQDASWQPVYSAAQAD